MNTNSDSMSAAKMTGNGRRISAQAADASQVAHSVASQTPPDAPGIRIRKATAAISMIPQLPAMRASRVVTRCLRYADKANGSAATARRCLTLRVPSMESLSLLVVICARTVTRLSRLRYNSHEVRAANMRLAVSVM